MIISNFIISYNDHFFIVNNLKVRSEANKKLNGKFKKSYEFFYEIFAHNIFKESVLFKESIQSFKILYMGRDYRVTLEI